MTTAKHRSEQARVLRLQIALNRMLPAERRCNDAIAKMEIQLALLEQRHLTIVADRDTTESKEK
jgi:hypothetical protein